MKIYCVLKVYKDWENVIRTFSSSSAAQSYMRNCIADYVLECCEGEERKDFLKFFDYEYDDTGEMLTYVQLSEDKYLEYQETTLDLCNLSAVNLKEN